MPALLFDMVDHLAGEPHDPDDRVVVQYGFSHFEIFLEGLFVAHDKSLCLVKNGLVTNGGIYI